MQEIAPRVYIETAYTGLTLGVISYQHGLVLIDAPFRMEDARSWRSSLLNLGGGIDRLLINLDAHIDRTLGVRVMECTVVGHEKMAEVFRNRPVTFKAQGQETGAEWEMYEGLGSTRWVPPEITFTDQLTIHWGDSPLILEQWPGSASGSICARLPDQNIIFIGDLVTPGQPPFLISADLPAWLQRLEVLTSPEYRNAIIINGRNGITTQSQVHAQIKYLQKVHRMLEELAASNVPESETEKLIPGLLAEFKAPAERVAQYERRLRWGLKHYYIRHYLPSNNEIIEEL